MYQLTFPFQFEFDASEDGITLPVTLHLREASTKTFAKVDTGCSACIFNRQVGEELGLNIEAGNEKRFSSVHGIARAFGHWVTLAVGPFQFDVEIYFSEDEYFPRNLLGRQGFLNQVKMGLVDYNGLLYLGRYDDEE